MFAIIEDGGRQYQVTANQLLSIDLRDDVELGSTITFDRVLLASSGDTNLLGRPHLDGATVTAEVTQEEQKGEKIEVMKKRRRRVYKRHTGHRQKYTLVKITAINAPGLPAEVVAAPEVAAAPQA